MNVHSKGFTLVELMVTVVVAGILLTVAVPSLVSLYEGQRARSTAATIESTFAFARNQAVAYGSRVSVCPLSGTTCGTDWTAGFSVFIDNGTLGSMDTTNGIADTVLRVIDPVDSQDFIKASTNRFTYNADGLMNGNVGGTIAYCPGSKTSSDSKGYTIGAAGLITVMATTPSCN